MSKNLPQVISDEVLTDLLACRPFEKVEKPYLESRISSADFLKIGQTVTLCTLTLDNGYSVRGESACVNAGNYDQKIGEKIAYEDAFSRLWALFGFLLAEKNFLTSKPNKAAA